MGRRLFTRRALGGAMVLTLAFAGAACGDDDDDDASGSEATTTTESGGDEGGDDVTAAFCEAHVALTLSFNTQEGPDPEEAEANVTQAEENTPPELEDAVPLAAAAVRDALAGDDAAFESEEVGAAVLAMDEYAFANCEATTGSIATVDYAFEGIPSTVPAGLNIVEVTNNGAEIHEIVLLRRNDGVTQPFQEIFALGEEQALELVTESGFAFVGEPGSTAYLYADVEPGNYIAACFIPVGATDFPTLEGLPEETPPHALQGMVVEFTVE